MQLGIVELVQQRHFQKREIPSSLEGQMPRKRVFSSELGESFVAALAVAKPTEVRTVVRDWAAEHKDELHDLVIDGLDWQADTWEQRIEELGEVEANRRYQGMLVKLDSNLYDLVLEVVATRARGEDGQNIRRHPVEAATSRSASDDEDYDDDDDDGRSANDDRSDSMNPNSDAYQASMDNRSDQMNPNNDAYHSSRR